MRKIIKLKLENTNRIRTTEDTYCEIYSHDKNNGLFEFEIVNEYLTVENPKAVFKFIGSNKVWQTDGTVVDGRIKVKFDTTLITHDEIVVCWLYLNEEQRSSDAYRFKFKVKLSEIDKVDGYETKERFIKDTLIVDRLDVMTREDLDRAIKDIQTGAFSKEGLLTEAKAEETYAKKSEAVDNTNFELVKNRVLALELKTDKDTVYDDSEVKQRLTTLENKPTIDTSHFVTDETLETKGYIKDVSNLATKEELEAVRGSQPSIDNLVTKDELASKNYLTEHQDTSNFALKSEIPQQYNDTEVKERLTTLENKAPVDLSNLATKQELNEVRNSQPTVDTSNLVTRDELTAKNYVTDEVLENKGYLKSHQSLENLVTKEELENKGYLRQHQDISNLATKEELAKAVTKDELASKNYVTEETLQSKNYLTEDVLNTKHYLTEHQPLDNLVTKDELENKGYLTTHQNLDNYALKSEIPAPYNDSEVKQRLGVLEAKQDKDTVYDDTPLKERVTALESKAIEGGAYDDSDLRNRVVALESKEDKDTKYDDTDLRNRVTNLENKPPLDTSEFVTNQALESKGYIKDVSNLVTKDELENKHYLTEHQELSSLVTKQELENKGYLTQHQPLDNLVTKEELSTKGYVTEEALNGKGYITSHQDLSEYAKKSEAYNDTDIKKRLTTLESRPNVDTSNFVTNEQLEAKHFLTEHQTLTHLATNSDLEALRNISVSKSELSKKVDTTEYNTFKDSVVTKTELAEKGYLTEHQNLDEYAKKSELETLHPNQTLSLNNGTLSISGGNSVELPVSRYEIHGTGMPNGVVEAEIGTTYIDKNKTNGAFKWIKTTNGENQGWEVLIGDTGWRTLNSISKLTVDGRTSTIKIRRVNNLVTYQFGGLQWGWFGIIRRNGAGHVGHGSSGDRGAKVLGVGGIPYGFRSEASLVGGTYDDRGRPYGVWYLGGLDDSNYMQFTFNDPIPTDRDIGDIRVSAVSYLTAEPWPTQLP